MTSASTGESILTIFTSPVLRSLTAGMHEKLNVIIVMKRMSIIFFFIVMPIRLI